MFINPQTAIDKGWVTFPESMSEEQRKSCIQPNALDITVDKIFAVNNEAVFVMSEDKKSHRGASLLKPDANDDWYLHGKQSYDITSDFFVKVPSGVAVLLIIRSSFNRNGLFITSGLYDSGFEGSVGMMLHNMSGPALIKKGTRVCQLIFVTSESAGMYAGGYNTAVGQHWAATDKDTN